ncbi:uncharacterized protein PAC_14846 [Phialocephala subalpina]|uniref:Zn(2)-C6 fungal-type domain-containing protein n=1 Tax=Phialocephala subalpina TaxID=576137 RepID=A0A1L7XJ15_9HELO|nr:uncharacterized protein PAC_14846 [Phialocephala subalpina]
MENPSGKEIKRRNGTIKLRTGCFTCKIRRVKCDESRSICARCKSFGVKCDGYPPAAKASSRTTSQSCQVLLPKSAKANTASVPNPLSITDFDNDNEKIYFLLFQEKTSNAIAPYFGPEAWRRLIMESCHVPSIQYGVLVIAALDRITMDAVDYRDLFLDSGITSTYGCWEIWLFTLVLGNPTRTLGIHGNPFLIMLTFVFRVYESNQIREKYTYQRKPRFENYLIACLLTATFETFHGDYSLANAQIRTGIDLLYEWKAAFPKDRWTLGYESPNPHVVETNIYKTFGRLELMIVYPDDRIPPERHEAGKSHETEILRSTPEVFHSLQEARVCLEVLLRRLEHYYYTSGVWPTETGFTDSPIDGQQHRNPIRQTDDGIAFDEPLEPQSQRFILVRITTILLFAIPTDMTNLPMRAWKIYHNAIILERNTTTPEAEEGKAMQEQHMKEILHWKSAFESLVARPDMSESSSSTLLRLHSKTSYMCLVTFSTTDLMSYDNLTNEIWDIVYLAKQLMGTSSPSQKSKFTLNFGAIIPLYFVGIKCRDSAARKVVIHLLLSKPRREGFWESQLVGRIVRWIQEIEEEFSGDGIVPAWARVRPIDIVFDFAGGPI